MKIKCRRCDGTGQYLMSGDAHRSPGIVPCDAPGCIRGVLDTTSAREVFSPVSTREKRDALVIEEQRKADLRKLMAEHLQIAYEPPPAELATGISTYGWPAVVKLVEHWIVHPESIPQPSTRVALNYQVQALNAEQLQREFEQFLTTAGIKFERG